MKKKVFKPEHAFGVSEEQKAIDKKNKEARIFKNIMKTLETIEKRIRKEERIQNKKNPKKYLI